MRGAADAPVETKWTVGNRATSRQVGPSMAACTLGRIVGRLALPGHPQRAGVDRQVDGRVGDAIGIDRGAAPEGPGDVATRPENPRRGEPQYHPSWN